MTEPREWPGHGQVSFLSELKARGKQGEKKTRQREKRITPGCLWRGRIEARYSYRSKGMKKATSTKKKVGSVRREENHGSKNPGHKEETGRGARKFRNQKGGLNQKKKPRTEQKWKRPKQKQTSGE